MGWNDRFLIDLVEAIKLNVSEHGERRPLYDELISLINNSDIDLDLKSAKKIDKVYDIAYSESLDEVDVDVTPYIEDEDDGWDDQDRDRF